MQYGFMGKNILMDFLTLERGYEILNFSED